MGHQWGIIWHLLGLKGAVVAITGAPCPVAGDLYCPMDAKLRQGCGGVHLPTHRTQHSHSGNTVSMCLATALRCCCVPRRVQTAECHSPVWSRQLSAISPVWSRQLSAIVLCGFILKLQPWLQVAAAAILTAPQQHNAKTYTMASPAESYDSIAAAFSSALGTQVSHDMSL